MERIVKLDADVEEIVEAAARKRGFDFDQMLNDMVQSWAERCTFSGPTYDMGIPRFDLTKALRIADDLDTEHRLRSMRESEPSR